MSTGSDYLFTHPEPTPRYGWFRSQSRTARAWMCGLTAVFALVIAGAFISGSDNTASGTDTTASASGATTHTATPDDTFLSGLDQDGITVGNPQTAESQGAYVCQMWSQTGPSMRQFPGVVNEGLNNLVQLAQLRTGLDDTLAAKFVGTATAAYCPQWNDIITGAGHSVG